VNWWSNPNDPVWWLWCLASFAVSALVTWLAIHYAHRQNLFDLPGRRRSHSAPTPRGGGIGIVVAVMLGSILFAWRVPDVTPPGRLMVAVGLVAIAGWIDDHRPLPAWSRLLAHCVATGVWLAPLVAAALSPNLPAGYSSVDTIVIVAVMGLWCVWSINLHNFMDGIDGLLTMQAVFVLAVLAVLAARDTASAHGLQLALWTAAILGFAPFNFPRARIFMGDVGSGAIGLLIAVAVIWQTAELPVAAASGAVAVSAFVADATFTLVSRMLRGRRWYTAHREHLYQWMTRSGMSHARVVAWYAGWNLLVVAPVLCWINRATPRPHVAPDAGYAWAVALYVTALAVWIFAKRWCLRTVKSSPMHASA
jgi:UDP-N-acetylmuramyl pentapeptide phosphotransferase/UDP-N-acetylglucosamine-1-phosphate transferase